MEDVFEHHLEPLGVPIVHNLPLGHGDHLCTIPLGVTATVDADARTVTLDDPPWPRLRLGPESGRPQPPRRPTKKLSPYMSTGRMSTGLSTKP